jgi:hypothetical protein
LWKQKEGYGCLGLAQGIEVSGDGWGNWGFFLGIKVLLNWIVVMAVQL